MQLLTVNYWRRTPKHLGRFPVGIRKGHQQPHQRRPADRTEQCNSQPGASAACERDGKGLQNPA
ncbi:hypothetical protein ABZ825_34250 [Streptomyces tauricus]|uniref:hypothetical protein n=1 Tax=Streptomyces tauricus TaxID=68274 RepID=UPI0033CA2900